MKSKSGAKKSVVKYLKQVQQSIPKEIFREYDIRGLVDKELSKGLYELLGRAYGTYLRKHKTKKAVVGFDNRLSSEGYER